MKKVRILLAAAAVVFTTAKASASEQCILSMSELESAPEIKRILQVFGGHEHLEGKWKLGGLAGSFKKTSVTFDNRDTSFFTQINEDAPAQIKVCTHTDTSTLKLVVLHPTAPEHEITLVQAVEGKPNVIKLAAQMSDWKFYKFKKVDLSKQEGDEPSEE